MEYAENDDDYEWPFSVPPRHYDPDWGGFPPGPGRPKGSRTQDLSGEIVGELTVLERVDDHVTPSGTKHPRYLVRCSCGNEITVLGTNLKARNTESCGHLADGTANRNAQPPELPEDWRERGRRASVRHAASERQRNGL